MRVLVTRPTVSAKLTAARLSTMGHEPVLLPLFEPKHDIEAIREALSDDISALAMTSAEAVRALTEVDISASTHLPVYAVGAVTAASARDAGFRNVVAGPGTGDQLADLIATHWTMQQAPLLYCAGNPRSPEFEVKLTQHGIPWRTVDAYRMIPRHWNLEDKALLDPMPDAVLLYSREAANWFFAQQILESPAAPVAATRIFCLSVKVAAAVPAQFQANVAVAAHPSEDALLSLLAAEVGTNFP